MVKIWLLLRASICHKQDFPIDHPLFEIFKKMRKRRFFRCPLLVIVVDLTPNFFQRYLPLRYFY